MRARYYLVVSLCPLSTSAASPPRGGFANRGGGKLTHDVDIYDLGGSIAAHEFTT